MTDVDRRTIIALSAGAIMTSLTPTPILAAAAIEPKPVGKPGDFDFLTGEWRIHNRFREGDKWIEFPAEATVVAILGGIASVEELRIPARGCACSTSKRRSGPTIGSTPSRASSRFPVS